MCGICGIVGRATPDEIARMGEAMQHRGPDGHGQWSSADGAAHFGHRRLAILDAPGGAQPMRTTDGQFVMVYNGEIYNHAELRHELEQLGHRFMSSHSDTETLLLGFRQWGLDLLPRLNGMFAFAVYDVQRRRLTLARDRFGEKPLFWTSTPSGLAFASELPALARWSGFDPSLSMENLQRYFAWGYFTAGRTPYARANSLRPGHALTLDADTGRCEQHRYWRFTLCPDPSWEQRPEEELAEELRGLLLQATRRRLISDVPLGVFLSGGVDSGAITAAMSQLGNPADVQAFTIGFREPTFDESAHAALVARHCGVDHHVDILDMDRAVALIPDTLRRFGEPLADPSLLPTWLLARFTRRSVTVALSGDAGDELFAGYDPFAALRPAQLYARLVPRWAHRSLRFLAELTPPSDANMSLEFKIKRTLRGLSQPQQAWLPAWMGPLAPEDIRALFERPLSAEDLYADVDTADGETLLERTLLFYTRHYLADDILTKVDRASMMESLESRAVFLDNDVADFCRRLPSSWKYRNGQRKYLLRRAVREWLPHSIIDRPKKGFGIPLNKWLRELPHDVPTITAGIHGDVARRAHAAHQARRGDHRAFLWAWLGLRNTGFLPQKDTVTA